MIFDKQRLDKLTEEFVTCILSDVQPDKMCFTVCYPLSLHLAYKGYENVMKSGWYDRTPHYIIILKNSEEIIIDPTIQQFDITKSQVLITSLSEAEEYKDFTEFIHKNVLNEWLYPLMNNGLRKKLPPDFLEHLPLEEREKHLKRIDISPILTIIDRAAHILEKYPDQSLEIKKYLETVGSIFNRNSTT
jgi:hypothetical protein